jgi:predicted nucleic acid-binding protein
MKAVLDACVLYPTVLREVLIGAARAGLITPLWSDRLIGEWTSTALRHGGPADEALACADARHLALAFPAAAIPADTAQEAQLWLPDPGDIHVLATAITGQADTIITLNLKDFPKRELVGHGVTARHPDAVLFDLWLAHPAPITTVVDAVHATAERLSGQNLPLRALLKRARLPRLAKALTR